MRVVVAGTFGPLHDGHRRLLTEALCRGDDGVVVCLTSDAFATRGRDRAVPPFQERRRAVESELDDLDRWDRGVDVVEIDDRYGVAIEGPDLDALVVSEETAGRVEGINSIREDRGMEPLEEVVVPLVEAEDGERISSTRVVEGSIDEHGSVESPG